MPEPSFADHSVSPPRIVIPREYNAAHDLLERNLRAGRKDKPAFVDDASTWTYGQLIQRVDAFAHGLRRMGLRMEERVLLCLLDTIDFPTAFLGCIKAGILPIPVNTLLTAADYELMLQDSRARALVVSAHLLPTLAPLLPRLEHLEHVIVEGGDAAGHRPFASLLDPSSGPFTAAPTTADDACFWLYSSGSTGPPKGTVHVQASLIQTAELYARPILGIEESDLVFSAAKLFFAYGLGNALTFPLAVGVQRFKLRARGGKPPTA